jgi:hypothetical protein
LLGKCKTLPNFPFGVKILVIWPTSIDKFGPSNLLIRGLIFAMPYRKKPPCGKYDNIYMFKSIWYTNTIYNEFNKAKLVF